MLNIHVHPLLWLRNSGALTFLPPLRLHGMHKNSQNLGNGLDGPAFISQQGYERFFSFPVRPERFDGHQASYEMNTRVSFPGVRRPQGEGEYVPSNTEVKNEWRCNSRLP
jgi:hypothetical protein